MELISIVIAIVLFMIFAGFFTYAYGFVDLIFPGLFKAAFLIIIGIYVIKFIIGRDK